MSSASCLARTATEMVKGARELRAAVRANSYRATIEVINRSAAGLELDGRMRGQRAPRLVLTVRPIRVSMCSTIAGRSMAAKKRRCRS